jgi:hypothetical protein
MDRRAVGQRIDGALDGTQWTLVPAPQPTDYAVLYDVSGSSSSDVWTVGYSWPDVIHPLVEHWNGTAWSQIPAPDGAGGNGLFYGVEAISNSDAWAVGFQDLSFSDFQPLVEHWDGTSWRVVPTPLLAGNDNFLSSVAASSSSDVWAVGRYRPDDALDVPLTMHWDGNAWHQVSAPSEGDQGSLLADVHANSPTDVWAVGRSFSSTDPVYEPFSLHWDGTEWSLQRPVVPQAQPAALFSVAATSAKDIWAVGSSTREHAGLLIEHSSGACP